MNQSSIQVSFAWCGVICVLLFLFALLISGFLPPAKPAWTADVVAEHYRTHTTEIRIGMSLMLLAGMFYAAFAAVISGQMRRIQGITPTLRYAQLAGGSFACLTFLVPAVLFLTTAYRPERDPSQTLLMNDLSWIACVIPWPPFMVQNFAFAFAILSDRSTTPLFPRWFGYMNIWAPISFTPGILLSFFKAGPFAWDGRSCSGCLARSSSSGSF